MLKLRQKDVHCTVSMRNSTGSPLFSDFKSDLSRVVRFRPLVKGNEDPGYEGVIPLLILSCAFEQFMEFAHYKCYYYY